MALGAVIVPPDARRRSWLLGGRGMPLFCDCMCCCNMKTATMLLCLRYDQSHTVVCPLVMERAIAYLRVSTQRQHRSGLGLDAQRAVIERFAAIEAFTIAAEFVEAESGKGVRRPGQAASAGRSAGRCEGREVQRSCCQARPIIARRGLCGRPDGPACAIYRCRAWPGCRPVHAAPLRGPGREGTAPDFRADQGRSAGEEGSRGSAGESESI